LSPSKLYFKTVFPYKKIAEIYSLGGAIILFAAYSAYGRISMRFSLKFPKFFYIVSIETFFPNCFFLKIVQINSLGGAIVLFAAYSVYGGISFVFSHLISRPSSRLSPSNFGGYK